MGRPQAAKSKPLKGCRAVGDNFASAKSTIDPRLKRPDEELTECLRLVKGLKPFRWASFSPQELARYKQGFEDGYDTALWDAVLLCEQTNTPKPEWLRVALERYAKDRINGVPLPKKNGRPTPRLRDIGIFAIVEMLRSESGTFGRKMRGEKEVRAPGPKAKVRRLSHARAFEMTLEMLPEENLTVRGIAQAYARAKKRLANPGAYRGSPFLECK